MPPRIIVCPHLLVSANNTIHADANDAYESLTRFEVDASTTTLRDVAELIAADPLLTADMAGVGLTLSPYEDGVAGAPIFFDDDDTLGLRPTIGLIVHRLVPIAAAANGLTEFAEGQELWLVVGVPTAHTSDPEPEPKAEAEAEAETESETEPEDHGDVTGTNEESTGSTPTSATSPADDSPPSLTIMERAHALMLKHGNSADKALLAVCEEGPPPRCC